MLTRRKRKDNLIHVHRHSLQLLYTNEMIDIYKDMSASDDFGLGCGKFLIDMETPYDISEVQRFSDCLQLAIEVVSDAIRAEAPNINKVQKSLMERLMERGTYYKNIYLEVLNQWNPRFDTKRDMLVYLSMMKSLYSPDDMVRDNVLINAINDVKAIAPLPVASKKKEGRGVKDRTEDALETRWNINESLYERI